MIQVADASTFTVEATLDGAAYTSGTPVLAEGQHELLVTATDAGNHSASVALFFEIDQTPPAFGAITPAAGSVIAAATVTLQGSATGAASLEVDGATVALSGGAFTAGPYSLVEGPREFALVATDAAGNSTSRAHRIERDAVAPTLAIGAPAAGAVVGESPLDVTGTASDLHALTVSVNGVAATRSGNNWTARVPLAEGTNQAAAQATDAAGNRSEARRTLVLDSAAPTLAITAPAAGTVVPGATLEVRGQASDAHLDRVTVNGSTASLQNGQWSATVEPRRRREHHHRGGGRHTSATSGAPASRSPATPPPRRSKSPRRPTAPTSPPPPSTYPATRRRTPPSPWAASRPACRAATSRWPEWRSAKEKTGCSPAPRTAEGHQGTHSILVYRDTVAPEIAGAQPADGAVGIAGNSVFEITFSEIVAGAPAASACRRRRRHDRRQRQLERRSAGGAPRPEPAVACRSAAGRRHRGGRPRRQPPGGLPAPSASPPATTRRPPPLRWRRRRRPADAPPASSSAVRPSRWPRSKRAAARPAAGTQADASGAFTLSVPLVPGTRHLLQLRARDAEGNVSAARQVDVTHDCRPPTVLEAAFEQGENGESGSFEITFDEPLAAASVSAASVKVFATSGPVAGGLQPDPERRQGGLHPGRRAAGRRPAARFDHRAARPRRQRPRLPFSQVFGGDAGNSFVAGRVIDAATSRPLAGARSGGGQRRGSQPGARAAADHRRGRPLQHRPAGRLAFRRRPGPATPRPSATSRRCPAWAPT